MLRISRDSINTLVEVLGKWDSLSADQFWKDVHPVTDNRHLVKQLYWENIREASSESPLSEILITRQLSHDLYTLAKKISLVAERLGDAKIKSIK